MDNLRDLLKSPNAESKIVKWRKSFETKSWAVKYIGRHLNRVCLEKYKDASIKGFKIELPWEGQESYVSYNAYDESHFIHELSISVYPDGPAAGRISDVSAFHWDHWHTSSNWQDHSESSSSNVRLPNEDEIASYEELLDGLTEGGSSEQIDRLVDVVADIAADSNGFWTVRYTGPSGELSLRHYGDVPLFIEVPIRALREALDVSHVYPEIMVSSFERQNRLKKLCSPSLEYFLTIFRFVGFEELYPHVEELLGAWLLDVFDSCYRYREFCGCDTARWWRDAWWTLQDDISDTRAICNNDYFYRTLVKNASGIKNPLCKWVGRVPVPITQKFKTSNQDDGSDLVSVIKGDRVMPSFKQVVIDGVEWSYCVTGLGAVIDLNKSRHVEECVDDVVFPERIDGHCVYQIRAIGESVPKLWRNVTIPRAVAKDQCEMTNLRIGVGAFRGWPNLEKVVIKPHLELGAFAFEDCSSLREIEFEGSVQISQECIFRNCKNLRSIKNLRVWGLWGGGIGEKCFWGCSHLVEVYVECNDGITIREESFAECTALTSVVIVDTSKPVGARERSRAAVKKPSRIESNCFRGCCGLRKIVLPASIKILCNDVFNDCVKLSFVQIEGDELWFEGANSLGKAELLAWGAESHYNNEVAPLGEMLQRFGIERERYIESCEKYPEERFCVRMDVLTGRRRSFPRHNDSVCDDYWDDFDMASPEEMGQQYPSEGY